MIHGVFFMMALFAGLIPHTEDVGARPVSQNPETSGDAHHVTTASPLFGIRMSPDNLPAKRKILFPVPQVPAFVMAGDSFEVLASSPVTSLSARGVLPCQRCPLNIGECRRVSARMWSCAVKTSARCSEGVYALEIKSNDFNVLQRLSLRVVPRGRPLTMVLTADHQLQDPTWRKGRRKTPGPHDNILITKQEIDEISAIAPDVAIHLGDLIFGARPRKELQEGIKLWNSRDFAMTFLPGNHDGYALYDVTIPGWRELLSVSAGCRKELNISVASPKKSIVSLFAFLSCAFSDLKSRLFNKLRTDSLEVWRQFMGPMDRTFSLGSFCFILLNTYSGSPQRRHSFVFPLGFMRPLGIRAAGVPMVDNYGGQLTPDQLRWTEEVMSRCARRGKTILVFGHQDPRGNMTGRRYTPDDPFPTDPISLDHFEEWNFDPRTETGKYNSGTRLTALLARYGGWYFSAHVHHSAVFRYEPGQEIVPGVTARKTVTFIKVTTGASMTRKGAWWGYAVLRLDPSGRVGLVSEDGRPAIPAGGFGWKDGELVSVLSATVPVRLLRCLSVSRSGYKTGWGHLVTCPGPRAAGTGLYIWEGMTPRSPEPYRHRAEQPVSIEKSTHNTPPEFVVKVDGHPADATRLWDVSVLEATSLHDEDGIYEYRWIVGTRIRESYRVQIPQGFRGPVRFEVRDGLCAWAVWEGVITKPPARHLAYMPPGCACAQGCMLGCAEFSLLLLLLVTVAVSVVRRLWGDGTSR